MNDCKKCIETTVGKRTQWIPVIFTVEIFAVCQESDFQINFINFLKRYLHFQISNNMTFEIGFWLIWEIFGLWVRVSTQNFKLNLSSRVVWPGEPFWKMLVWALFPKITFPFVWETTPKMVWAPNVPRSLFIKGGLGEGAPQTN